jgi:VanZ family protein
VRATGISPYSGGTVPDLHRVPLPSAYRARPYHRPAMPNSRVVSAWLPVFLWAAVIFAFSAVPHLGTGLGTWDFVLRKIAHACEYAVLGLLLVRATRREHLAVLIGVLYAATDELHQHFVPGRHATVRDVAIDAAGVVLGVLAARTIGAWNERT